MRVLRWFLAPLILVSACQWKGDGNDEFIRDPFQRTAVGARSGAGKDRRNFGVPEQQVPRSRGRADEQMRKDQGAAIAEKDEHQTGVGAVNTNKPTPPSAKPHGKRP